MYNLRFELIAILFLLTVSLLPSAFASPDSYTLTSGTGIVDLVGDAKISINYTSQATISHSSTIGKGETKFWDIGLQAGTIDISVYVPSPLSQWYSVSTFIPIGSYYDVSIATGISARVEVVSSASLDLIGDARLSTDSLSWSSEGTKTISVTTYSYASGNIIVESNFNFQINVGLVIGVPPLSIEIAKTDIGTFPASPKVTESMTISIPFYERILGLIFGHPVFLVIAIATSFLVLLSIAMIISGRRKRKKLERTARRVPATEQVRKSIPKPPKRPEIVREVPKHKKAVPETGKELYCIHCGEKLPSHAVYCRKCGKKIE